MQQQLLQHVLAAVHAHVQQKMDASIRQLTGERLWLQIGASLESCIQSIGESLQHCCCKGNTIVKRHLAWLLCT